MSHYVSSPTWMGVMTLISLVIMLIGVPMMYVRDETKSTIISYFVLVTTFIFLGFIFYGASQQQGNLRDKNFTVTRSGDTIHVTSKTPWIQSKDFTIHSENNNYIYVQDDPNPKTATLYEINKNELD